MDCLIILSVLFQNRQPVFQIFPENLLDLLKMILLVQSVKNRSQFFFAMLPDKSSQSQQPSMPFSLQQAVFGHVPSGELFASEQALYAVLHPPHQSFRKQ